MPKRRTALLGAGLALAASARAQDGSARQDAAFAALAGASGVPELARGSAMLLPET